MEQIKKEMETDAFVKFKNGKSFYGVIIDYFSPDKKLENIRFVPNFCINMYRATENEQFVMILKSEDVIEIDTSLK